VLYPAGHDMLFLFLILFSVLAVAMLLSSKMVGGCSSCS
jgi:hypothetical protein